ncbi:hypothetical protein SLS62_000203 [Diatrype stigma]|uniref:Uncharacterized protein n=1 Tax=Diatrype stigma TaxID=117547 RepID=A0AAN9V460_9PEZI
MSPPGAEPSTSAAAHESVSPGSDDNLTADHHATAAASGSSNANVPKPKRHSCAYDEVRRKSGPKRGYVKALEERLKQVETLLKTQEPAGNANVSIPKTSTVTFEQPQNTGASANINVTTPNIALPASRGMDQWRPNAESPQNSSSNDFNATAAATAAANTADGGMDDFSFNGNISMGINMDNSFTWEMIGLGLEEPLPPQDTIDEL